MSKKLPLIIDNCVLGNLYSAKKISLLGDLYSGEIIIPSHVKEGEDIIADIIKDGNKMPINSFQDIINWFKDGVGKKLY